MKRLALLFVITAGILWGTSGLFVSVIAPYGISSIQMSFIRGSVSFLIISAFTFIFRRRAFRTSLRLIPLFALVGLSLFGTAGCYYSSMQMTSVSTAVILMYTAPIYVSVFSLLVWKEKFTKSKVIALITIFVGCCLVSGIVGGISFNAMGILLGFLSGISYAVYNILTKLLMKLECDPLSVTVYGFFFMSLFSGIVSKPHLAIKAAVLNPHPLILLFIGLGVITFVLPYFLYTLSMRSLPCGTVSALGIIEPLSATVFGVMLLNESLSVFSVIGIIMILISTVILGRSDGDSNKEFEAKK